MTDNYARTSPHSANGTWSGGTADTGASNNFRDQPAPAQRTAVVGGQFLGQPAMSDRDAAVAAIKKDLSRPKRWGAGGDDAGAQDRTEDLDQDDSDPDDDESRQKDPNSDDAFSKSPRKRKHRGDEDDDE